MYVAPTSVKPDQNVNRCNGNSNLKMRNVNVPSLSRNHCDDSQSKSNIALWATNTPRQRPPPRRNLKKRPRRNRRSDIQDVQKKDVEEDVEIEVRPLVNFKSKEAGLDYWMDEDELKKSIKLEKAIKNRKAMETEIPQEKLRSEVLAPYKQNWIGLLSVSIIVLTVIIREFPDLLDSPMIPIPDL